MSNLRDCAMLVRLSISQWSGRKFDKQATDLVGATLRSSNIGRFNKLLVDPALIKGVQQAAGQIRSAHYMRTMPWNDDDYRILPSAMHFEHSSLMQQLEAEYWQQVDFVVQNYEQEKALSQQRLGYLFNEREYPDSSSLRELYGVKWTVIPIPDGRDFRVDIGEEQVSIIRQQIESSVATAQKGAIAEIWQRLGDVVSKAHERLSTPDAIFRDSLIGNIDELCELIPKLNFAGDPDLNRLRDDVLLKVAKYDPKTLRDSPRARKEAADGARDILAQIDSLFGKRG